MGKQTAQTISDAGRLKLIESLMRQAEAEGDSDLLEVLRPQYNGVKKRIENAERKARASAKVKRARAKEKASAERGIVIGVKPGRLFAKDPKQEQ